MLDKNGTEVCSCECVHGNVVEKVSAAMADEDELYEVSELFKVFGDSTRTRILSGLAVSEMCVCDIASLLNMTKSAISHQLRILRQTKLVKIRKKGKEVYYSLADDHVASIYKMALEHVRE